MTASEHVLLDCFKFDSVCTDGVTTMAGRSTGCVALLEKVLYQQYPKYYFIVIGRLFVLKTWISAEL